MLFMGEEWGSKAPFPFFCDFKGGLADAVRKGRKQEYNWAYEKYGDEVPDPLDVDDLQIGRARLGHARHAEGAKRLALVRELLARPRARDRAAAEGRDFRRGPGRRQRPAHRALAHGRWRDAAADRQSVAHSEIANAPAHSRARRSGAASPATGFRPGRCSGASEAEHASRHSACDLSPATDRRFRFREGRRGRALSEGARHHAISMPRRS